MQIDHSRQRAICSLLSVAVGILFFAAPIAVAGEALNKKEIVELDEERKAAMVSNLMVILCGDKEASPVLNTGTLNH